LFGTKVAHELEAPFVLGNPSVLSKLLNEAEIGDFELQTVMGEARFESLDAWVRTDVRGWTLADKLDEPMSERLRTAAATSLSGYVLPDIGVRFASPAHIVVCTK
jgi:hypothetical protein